MTDDAPFEDVEGDDRRFRLPRRKWRELLFIGAMVPDPTGRFFVRDTSRPLPAFRKGDLFPEGAHFEVREDEEGWVSIDRVDGSALG